MKKVLIPFRFGVINDYFKNKKENPNEFLYGTHELILREEVDTVFCPRGKKDSLLRIISFFLQKPFTKMSLLGMPVEIVFENINEVRCARKILCINDPISLAFLFCKKIGIFQGQLITMFQSITERRRMYFSRNKYLISFYRWLMKESDMFLVLSDIAKKELSEYFGVPLDKIKVFRFGADCSFWKYRPYERGERSYFLSVGNDSNRDFDTLVDALAEDNQVIIVTNRKVKKHKNVKVVSGLSNEELRDLYYGAIATITPSVKIVSESSGLSTTVQSMSCGTPVFLSNTPAIEEVFFDNREVCYFTPGDAQALLRLVESRTDSELSQISSCARKKIESTYNSDNMSEQMISFLSD